MSKADDLGESSAFDAMPPRRRTRRELINEATGVESHTPGTAPRNLPLSRLAHNPFNPRVLLPEIQETADSLLERGQIQPITVITRAAFLNAHPEAEEQIGVADFIVLDGNRRLAAAHLAGMEELRVDVNDDLAETAADLLESALIANIQREDLTPLEQARGLSQLMKVHGSLRQVARRVGKTHVWVSQRLALLDLTPDLQKKLASKELSIEDARQLGKIPKQRQAEEAVKLAAARAPGVNGVNTRSRPARNPKRTPSPGPTTAPGGNGVNTSSPGEIDWHDIESLAGMLRGQLDTVELATLISLIQTGPKTSP